VAHDAVTAAQARKADYLFIDTAGRLHTKHNLMQELQKLHRVIGKQLRARRTRCCWCWTAAPA
jgi:fused signal recognition particle receptor